MAQFLVVPQVLDRAADRFTQLSGDVDPALRYLAAHNEMGTPGGLAGLILDTHGRLQDEAALVMYTAQNLLADFAENFAQTYRAYRNADFYNEQWFRQVWSELPENPNDDAHHRSPGHYDDDLGTSLPSASLHEPTQLSTSTTVMKTIDALINNTAQRDAYTEIFKWVFRAVTGLDFDATTNRVLRMIIGDWHAVGLLASLYDNYAGYFTEVAMCSRDARVKIFDDWRGDAADIANAQLLVWVERSFALGDEIDGLSHRYTAAALGLFGLVEDSATLIDELLGTASQTDQYIRLHLDEPIPVLIGEIAGALLGVAETMFKVVDKIVLVARIVKAVTELIMVVQARFAHIRNTLPSDA